MERSYNQGKEFARISFDLENNESTGEKKTILIEKNLRKDQPVKYKINTELCAAGGDWEYSVLYFKIQMVNNYSLTKSTWKENPEYIWDIETTGKKLFNCYVMIPPKEASNPLTDNIDSDNYDWRAYQDSEDFKGMNNKEIKELTKSDHKLAWKWLENTIEEAINKRHERLDENLFEHISNILKPKTTEEVEQVMETLPKDDLVNFMAGEYSEEDLIDAFDTLSLNTQLKAAMHAFTMENESNMNELLDMIIGSLEEGNRGEWNYIFIMLCDQLTEYDIRIMLERMVKKNND